MSEPVTSQEIDAPKQSRGRVPKIVAALALVVAIAAAAVAALSFVKVTKLEDDLDAAQSSLADVQSELSNETQHRSALENQLDDVSSSVQTVTDDLADTSALASNIDSFLSTANLASADDVTSALSDESIRVDDLINCINDNLEAISRGRQMQFCG